MNPSSGVLNPVSATTGASGAASTTLTLGNTAGSYTVTASVSGIAQTVTFTATATDNGGGNGGGNTPQGNSGVADDSHLFYEMNSPIVLKGWLVWVYYPENYKGRVG